MYRYIDISNFLSYLGFFDYFTSLGYFGYNGLLLWVLILADSENQGSGRCYLRFFVQSTVIWGLTQWWERSVMSPKHSHAVTMDTLR